MVDQLRPVSTLEQAELAAYVERGLEHLWVHSQNYEDLAKPGGMLVLTEGDGVWLTDASGKRYIDGISGLWVVNVGHGRGELAEVAASQMRSVAYINTFAYTTTPPIDLAAKLAEITVEGIERFFFVNSGAEAVETAIKMAKQYHYNGGDQKRFKVIARRGSYNGQSMGAISVNGANYTRRAPFEPLMPGSLFVPGINCYHCPYEKTYPACDVFCGARVIEQLIQFEKPETIAAFIAEPISTAHGCFVPPVEYWQGIREVCDRYGILLIADEVINGFGRTGKWFGIEHFGIKPDITTMAKGLSSGYMPISCAGATLAVAERFVGKANTFAHNSTFGTHPVAAAVALANIGIMEREHLVENSAAMGAYLKQLCTGLAERHPLIGEVRGIGLMLQIELVKNRETHEAFSDADGMTERLTPKLVSRGLLTRAGGAINLAPPLCITRGECEEIAAIVDAALGELETELGVA
ncbi:MAG: aminotransferase family protein [Dehalococcoidia bacterium]